MTSLFVRALVLLLLVTAALHAQNVVITPAAITSSTSGTDLYPAANLINGSGLSGTPTPSSLGTHAAADSSSAWVTAANSPDYFAGAGALPAPVLTCTLPTVLNVSELVIWGYNVGGNPIGNEGKVFQISFSTNGSTFADTVTVTSSTPLGSGAVRLPFPGGARVATKIRIMITDNHYGASGASGVSGGDRVGLGEIRFIGPQANTLVDVSGPVTTGGQIASTNQAIATVFTLAQTFNNVRVSTGTAALPFIVVSGSGDVSLMKNLGPGATGGDIVATKPMTNSGVQFIDVPSLPAGTYYFLISVNSGTIGWNGTFSSTVTTNNGSSRVLDLFASATGGFPVDANYSATSGVGKLLYTVTGDLPVYTVTTTADELDTPAGANISLREAMRDAPDGGTIQFAPALAGQSIVLDSAEGELVCNKNLVIDTGGSALTLDGGTGTNRVFNISAGKTLTLTGFTLTGGNGGGSHGGAIYNAGTLNITRCTFAGNTATGFYGGAIHNNTGATLTATNSTFTNNSAQYGGALENFGTMTLNHVTVSGNSGSAGSGGIDFDNANVANIGSTIIAGNAAPTGADTGYYAGTITQTAANLIGSNDHATAQFPAGPLTGTSGTPLDPKLAPLGSYGGTTQTMALKPGSPAGNAATPGTTTGDQRGFPIIGTPDIGAYEAGTLTNYNAWIWELLPATATVAQHAAAFDFDGDGQTNNNEWLALTDPGNANSFFHTTNTTITGSNIAVTFATVIERNYTVEYSTDFSSWTPVSGANYAGTGSPITSTLGPITGYPKFFLHVRVGL